MSAETRTDARRSGPRPSMCSVRHLTERDFTRGTVHRIELDRELHCSSKYDRCPSFIRELIELDEQQADEIYNQYWRNQNP